MSVKGEKMKSRLLDQFQVSTKLKALLDVINARFDDSDAVLDYLLYYRFLDTASGVWLDVIGVILGVFPRPFEEQSDNIFTYKGVGDLDDATLAFADVTQTTGGSYQSINGLQTTTPVDDDTYRALLKAKIFSSYVEPTIPNVYLFIKRAFGIESTVTVPTPGTVEIEIASALTPYQRRLLVQYAPVGAGYGVAITNWP